MRIWPVFHFETSLFSFLVLFLFLFFVLILSLILFHFSSHKSLYFRIFLECQNCQSQMGKDRRVTHSNKTRFATTDQRVGIVLKEQRGQECLPHALQHTDAILTYLAGKVVRIPHKLMVRFPGQFFSTGIQIAVTNQLPSK